MAIKLRKVVIGKYQPLRDVVFDALRQSILKGDLQPGERMLEIALAQQLGVSRTPVRDAIRKLEREGLVVMLPRKGAHVARYTTRDIEDVLEIRCSLDGLASFLAARRISSEQKHKLTEIYQQLERCLAANDFQGAVKRDVMFHELIYEAADNYKLVSMAEMLIEQVQRFRMLYMCDPEHNLGLVEEHLNILNAIVSGDAKLAREYAEQHIHKQSEAIIEQVRKNGEVVDFNK